MALQSSPRSSPIRQGFRSKESPWDSANILSKYSLWFIFPLLRKGYRDQIEIDDLGAPPASYQSKVLGSRLQHNYNQELISRKRPSFARALFATFGWELVLFSILDLLARCVFFPMQTIALGWIIRDTATYLSLQDTSSPAGSQAFMTIVYDTLLMLLFSWLPILISHPYFLKTYQLGMQCRVAACQLIYKKALRLSQSSLAETTVGQLVNLLSNDVNRFDQLTQMLPYIILAPLQAIVILVVLSLFYLGGLATLASLVAILVYALVQALMGRGFSKFRSQTARRTDQRVRLMNEIIMAMRIIKMYAWEEPFKQLVYASRRREMLIIGISSILKVINQALFFVSSKIIVFAALVVYVALDQPFTPEVVFVAIGLANLVRLSLTLFFPNAVSFAAESLVSCRRINNFLLLPELQTSAANYKATGDVLGCSRVLIMNRVYASWASPKQDQVASPDSRVAIIRNLSLSVRARELVLVVGRVGAGKSSLLMSILGELPITSGRLEVNGRLAYASQEALIFSGTVRDNILFGRPMERERYDEVLRVCSLERDLSILVDGDQTVVGERGVSLSGGQKARVSLARTLYGRADVYLLDDPLAAVDAPVARSIFNESIRTFLRKKTVILATHQLQFLRHASKVLVVDRDLPAAFGTLEEVMQSESFKSINYGRGAFEDATTTEATETDAEPMSSIDKPRRRHSGGGSSSSSQSPPGSRRQADTEQLSVDRQIRASSQASSNLSESIRALSPAHLGSREKSVDIAPTKQPTKTIGSEQRKGTEQLSAVSANCGTLAYYMSCAAGPIMLIWFLLTNLFAQGVFLYTDYFLTLWSDSVQRREAQGAAFQTQTYVDSLQTSEIVGVYSILVALCLTGAFARVATLYAGTIRASIRMHDQLFKGLVHAPMGFFDFSPIGALLNRLTRDMGFVDETLPLAATEIVTIFVNIGGILVLFVIVDYMNVGATIALILLAVMLRQFSAKTIRRLKQAEGVTRSPVFSHLANTLAGLATIRAFRVQPDFVRTFEEHQDRHSSAWFNYICATRWLAIIMDWLNLIFISVIVALLLALTLDTSNASLIGLIISQLVVLPGPFQYGMRQIIEVESQMTSVQRIREFSQIEPEEKVLPVIKERDADDYDERLVSYQAGLVSSRQEEDERRYKRLMPEGEITFVNLTLSYLPEEPPVLKDLCLTIKPREKVGIVGRTGAGKSSLVAALFRLYHFEGRIEIDGRDTRSMELAELRSSMSIIPQDPILFAGSIRKNLDPFGKHTDSELWAALDAVQLRAEFARHSQGLDYLISEGGSNFSVGQRQLVCLARAIVRRNRVLVLDEATANVDPETDEFIQKTIASRFKDCTVLTIAHRLITVAEADRLLVLDAGRVVEFDEPWQLLRREPASHFAQMVASSPLQAPRLIERIELAHKRRQGLPVGEA